MYLNGSVMVGKLCDVTRVLTARAKSEPRKIQVPSFLLCRSVLPGYLSM